jgi:lipoate-protein ligase A
MARDHALATSLKEGEGVLRLYRWSPPTISFGRNEPSRGLYREDVAREEGIGFVRRPTGGRAVLHHEELTYALVFPLEASGGSKASYRRINEGLLAGIQALGAAAELAAASGRSLPPDAGPCFRQPAEGEVTALGRKLIGSAQVRMGESVLQHGSIILEGDQGFLRRVRGDSEEVPPPATLRSLLGVLPELDALAGALRLGLATVLGGSWREDGFREDEKRAAEALGDHYLDPEWTWRL